MWTGTAPAKGTILGDGERNGDYLVKVDCGIGVYFKQYFPADMCEPIYDPEEYRNARKDT